MEARLMKSSAPSRTNSRLSKSKDGKYVYKDGAIVAVATTWLKRAAKSSATANPSSSRGK